LKRRETQADEKRSSDRHRGAAATAKSVSRQLQGKVVISMANALANSGGGLVIHFGNVNIFGVTAPPQAKGTLVDLLGAFVRRHWGR
jgi:hypothetical protein